MVKNQRLAFALSPIVLALSGCGGSSNNPDPTPTPEPTPPVVVKDKSLSGIAIDGYLGFAKACIDLNNNYQCDGDSEFQTLTDEQGRFTLSYPNDTNLTGSLLIEASAGVTVDSDNPNATIDGSFTLLSSSTSIDDSQTQIVSPLTTLVDMTAKSLSDTMTPEQALAAATEQVAKTFNIEDPALVNSDFIAQSNDDSLPQAQKDQAKRVHLVAQVVTDVIATNITNSQESNPQAEQEVVTELVLKKVNDASTVIVTTIDEAIAENSDVDSETISEKVIKDNPALVITPQEVEAGQPTPIPTPTPTPTPTAPAAPTLVSQNDTDNEFTFAINPDFPNVSDYEYTLDSGNSWTILSNGTFTVFVDNIDAAIGQVGVRVVADSDANRPAGEALFNQTAFNIFNNNVAAPNSVTVNDEYNTDTVDWEYVAGFETPQDYEYHTGNEQWKTVTTKPISIGNTLIAANEIKIRVKAGDAHAAGSEVSVAVPFTVATSPSAPTISTQDDDANQITFAPVSGFNTASLYEYQLKGGAWQRAASFTIQLEGIDYAIGDINIRLAESLTAGSAHPAGAIVANTQAFTVAEEVLPKPTAPTQGVVDDTNNTFTFTAATGYSSVSDYEYSLDSGSTWQTMAGQSFVVNVGNVDLAVGAVIVRVKEDSDTKRPVGNTLSNGSEFTYFNDNVAAPSPIVANDNYGVDTLDWDFVSGFNSVSDYEYHLGDNQWQDTTVKPIVIGNTAIASNSIELRVKATDKNAAGAVASVAAAYTVATVPAAPVISSEDDDANTLTFTAISGYDNVSLYQIKIADRPWQTASSFTITLEDIDYAAGEIQVRLAENLNATTPHPAGSIASNQQVFTPNTDVPAPAAPTNPIHNNADDTFGFTPVSGYSSNDDYEYTLNGGTTWNDFFPLSRLEVSVGNDNIDAGQVGVRVKADEASNRPAGVALFSTQAYTSFERFPTSPGNFVVDDTYGVDTLDWQYVAGYPSPENYEYNLGDGQWVTVSQKPIVIGNIAKGSSAITMRVKASDKNGSSIATYVSSEFTVAEVPAAPTIDSENDATNEIVFNPIDGYIEANLFEVKIADGDWTTAESFTINLEDIDYTAGSISIRLAENLNAATPHPAGQSVSNTKVFTPTPATPTAPTGLSVDDTNDTLDWQFVTGYEQYTDYEIQLSGSNTYQAIKQKPVIVGNTNAAINSISIRVKADAETGRQAGESASNPVAFTIPASQLLAVVADHQQTIDALNTVLAEFNTLKAGLSGTGDALRTQAKTLNAKWFELATLTEQATTAQTAIDSALTSAASFETQSNKDAVQMVLNNLTTDLNAAKPLVAATDSAIIDAFNDAHSQASVTQANAMIPLTTFAKLDVAGNLVETNTTVEQGWRCVLDTSAKTRVVWALLSPVKATEENATFSDTQTRQSDVYNAQEICGVSTWQLPTNAQAKTIDSGTPQNWVKVTTAGEITDAAEFKYWLDGANTRLWQRVEDQSALVTESDDVSDVAANFASASWTLATQAIWQAVGDDPNATAFVATLSKDYKYWATPEGAYADFSGDSVTTGSWTSFGETAYKLAMADLNVADVPKVELITNSALFPNHNAQSYWLAEELDSDGVATGNIATLTYPDSEVAADNATTATSRFVMVSAPQTPALIATDDAKNKVTVSLIENYAAIEDYELTTDGGSNWNTLTSDNAELKTIDDTLRLVVTLSNANIDKNDIGIRVAKTQTIPASGTVNSDIDFTQSRCDGTEINGICYQAFETPKTWQESITSCSNLNLTIVSREAKSDWTSFATDLSLANTEYWLLEEDSFAGYAYSLKKSSFGSNWSTSTSTRTSTKRPFICQKDFEAPVLNSQSINDNDVDIAINVSFTFTFNEVIKDTDIADFASLKDVSNNDVAITITTEDKKLLISPNEDLSHNTQYILQLDGLIYDLYDNSLIIDSTINFTTAQENSTPGINYNGANYVVNSDKVNSSGYTANCQTIVDRNNIDKAAFAQALSLDSGTSYRIGNGVKLFYSGFGPFASWNTDWAGSSEELSYICKQ